MERVRKKNEHKPQIKLTTKRPVPVEVLEFVTCNYKKKKADARQINAHVFPST